MSDELPKHTGKPIKREPYEHAIGDMGYEPRIFLKVIAYNVDDDKKPDALFREQGGTAAQYFGGGVTAADVAAACVALVNTTRDLVESVAQAVADNNPNIKKGQFLKGVYAEVQGLNLQHPDRRMEKHVDPVKPRRREKEGDDGNEDKDAAPASAV